MDEKRMGAEKVASKPKRVARVGEIEALRGRNSKVFRMSDGSEQAVFRADGAKNAFNLTEDGKHYWAQADGFHAEFSREAASDELFSVKADQHRITVCNGQGKKNRPKLQGKTLRLEDAAEGVDMEYSPACDGVKENILIKQKAESYRYPFIIRGGNITSVTEEGKKQISFISKENGEEVFLIPAPFMVDAVGNISASVSYEIEELADDAYCITVVPNAQWLNAEDRAFPVTVDPQVVISGSSGISTYSLVDNVMQTSADHVIGGGANRMYLHFNLPTLPRNPRIQKAELVFTQKSCSLSQGAKLALYQITEEIVADGGAPAQSTRMTDYEMVKVPGEEDEEITYTFDVTRLLDAAINGDETYQNMVLELMDATEGDSITLYGSADADNTPSICVTYKSSYGVNTSHRANTHEMGRFGQGSVDLVTGALMFECVDFAWGGNRMPVTLKHLYTSALGKYLYTASDSLKLEVADFSAMKFGLGWRMNIMQSMVPSTFQHEGTMCNGYVYTGENGEEVYFKSNGNFLEALNGSDMVYNEFERKLTQGDEIYLFDEKGRLIQIQTNLNLEQSSSMTITYENDQITCVTDAVGRSFAFTYNDETRLTSIIAEDGSGMWFSYTRGFLDCIAYPDGAKTRITTSDENPMLTVKSFNADGSFAGMKEYYFVNNRITLIGEYGAENGEAVLGKWTYHNYYPSQHLTVLRSYEQPDSGEGETENKLMRTVYTFDEDDNVISEYTLYQMDEKIGTQGSGLSLHPLYSDGGVSGMNACRNFLRNHNFVDEGYWTETETISYTKNSDTVRGYFGTGAAIISSSDAACTAQGIQQIVTALPAGEYTYSAYLRLKKPDDGENPCIYIRVKDSNGNVLSESERIGSEYDDYTRVSVTFKIAQAQDVAVQILMDGKGTAYANAAQLEEAAFASEYNLLQNGTFNHATDPGWVLTEGMAIGDTAYFWGPRALDATGDVNQKRTASQVVPVCRKRSTRETFTLSGWAKGTSIPVRDREGANAPTYRLRAVIHYADSDYDDFSEETFTADFAAITEGWNYASVQFAKSKYRRVENIEVFCDYDYNTGTACMDDIQLIRNSVETELSLDDFEIPVEEDLAPEEAGAEEEYGYEAPEHAELVDAFGNARTETTFTDGEFGTIYRSFGYDENGNHQIRETDARGNVTTHTYNEDNSRITSTTDRCGTRTSYWYDMAGRTTKVISRDSEGKELANVSYAYDYFDELTEITRGDGLKYVLAYDAYHNLESIGVDGKTEKLVGYTYKTGNGRLKQISYANGDHMKASYNHIGQMIAEKWYDANDALTAHYKYVYDHNGNIVRSVDILARKEYNYTYEDGRLVRGAEFDITVNDDGFFTIGKTLVAESRCSYDAEGNLVRKRIRPAGGAEQVIYYENVEGQNAVVKFTAGGKTVTSHSKSDSFGRKSFEELQLGTGFLYRQFQYHAGQATDEHVAANNMKSAPTTNLVRQIILSDGTKLSYEYDNEERITKVTETDESGAETVTQYTYDALGQLLTEEVDGVLVNSMTYDNYGNILTKNGKSYVYGDATWKDLLTSYDGQSITYDAQGNPTSYLGHTLTWEKGRQLKSFDNITYTYNANGIRTSKTVNGVKHTYTLDGAKILRETWGDNVLIPLYDNEDSVCGILYNEIPYYFLKNLQGDIIAITDKNGATVAKYRYDAWGGCAITLDDPETGIATINPFRYRGYYYDAEIELYYLQSRYYDSTAGRFINADSVNTLQRPVDGRFTNLYRYCNNNPVNETDLTGMFLASKLAEIFLSAVFGMVAQLFDDLVIYFLQVLVHGKSKVGFSPNPSDYVSRALSWALECVNPFSGKKKILNVILSVAPVVVKSIWDLVAGKQFDLWSFLRNIMYSLLAVIVANVLGKVAKNKISQIKKKYGGRKPKFKAEKLKIKAKYTVLGNKITTCIDIASVVIETVLAVIFI